MMNKEKNLPKNPQRLRSLSWFVLLGLAGLLIFSCKPDNGLCTEDTHCPADTPRCVEGACQQCTVPGDCLAGQRCAQNKCTSTEGITESNKPDASTPETSNDANKPDLCGNGQCDIGVEDCLSCAQDCACAADQVCQNGICNKRDSCGNGKCDPSETCGSCLEDCACTSGQLCADGKCQAQASCGNGTCEGTENENCVSCPLDCTCPGGQTCSTQSSSCKESCGDGKCDPRLGENCITCAKDCVCHRSQRCNEGRCEWTCGNSRCETSYGEDCGTCPQDCPCDAKNTCTLGECGTACGDGKCDASAGENCSTCTKDCACASGKICTSGKCGEQCGNRICDLDKGENCDSCPADCACPKTHECNSSSCKHRCGNRKCEQAEGENCSTCPTDCTCPQNQSCRQGQCKCIPNCNGKLCGDDGCGGTCGTCEGLTACNNGKCECKHSCTAGYRKCLSTSQYERCDPDAQGCRSLKTFQCQQGNSCKEGSCCASACQGKSCGPDGCGGDCGVCADHASCQSGQCVCQHECTAGEKRCVGTSYQACLTNAAGCRYWSKSVACTNSCLKGSCCTPLCNIRECGSDGCDGSCGTCTEACINNLCLRKMLVARIYLPCGLCKDTFGNPDIYIELTLPGGQTFKSQENSSKCDKEITFNWSVSRLDPFQLKNAKISIYDSDSPLSPELCGSWNGDLSTLGTRTLTNSKIAKLSLTMTVSK